jgi:hypothetical protein
MKFASLKNGSLDGYLVLGARDLRKTSFMHFGDRVRMEACYEDGSPGPFGAIDLQVVRAP